MILSPWMKITSTEPHRLGRVVAVSNSSGPRNLTFDEVYDLFPIEGICSGESDELVYEGRGIISTRINASSVKLP